MRCKKSRFEFYFSLLACLMYHLESMLKNTIIFDTNKLCNLLHCNFRCEKKDNHSSQSDDNQFARMQPFVNYSFIHWSMNEWKKINIYTNGILELALKVSTNLHVFSRVVFLTKLNTDQTAWSYNPAQTKPHLVHANTWKNIVFFHRHLFL